MYLVRPPHATVDALGLSPALWNSARLDEIRADRNKGFFFWDDFFGFLETSEHQWNFTDNTAVGSAATALQQSGDGGIVRIGAGSTTAGEGGQIQTPTGIIQPTATSEVYFETRVRGTSLPAELVIGLAAADTTVLAGSANSTADHIAFESVSDDNVLLFHTEDNGNRSSTTAVHTLVDATWTKLGFHVKGLEVIEVFVNGVHLKALDLTTNICDVTLCPTFAWHGPGTTTPSLDIDWVGVAKKYRIG